MCKLEYYVFYFAIEVGTFLQLTLLVNEDESLLMRILQQKYEIFF